MASLCVSSSHVVVQTAPGALRVMDGQTGKKLGKVKAGGKGSVAFSNMKLVDGSDILIATLTSGAVALYSVSNCEETWKMPHQLHSGSTASALSDGLLQLVDQLHVAQLPFVSCSIRKLGSYLQKVACRVGVNVECQLNIGVVLF